MSGQVPPDGVDPTGAGGRTVAMSATAQTQIAAAKKIWRS